MFCSREYQEGIIIITIEITDPTIEIDLGIITDVITEEIPTGLMRDAITTDRTTEGEITIDSTTEIDKILEVMTPDKDTQTEVKVGIGPEIIVMIVLEVEMEVETETGGCKIDPGLCQMTEEDQGLDLTQE